MNTQHVIKNGHWGAWGNCGFKTLTTPQSLRDTRAWRIPAQQVLNGYPQHQHLGESERTISLAITLHNQFCDLTKMHNTLLAQSQGELAEPLVIGHEVLGTFACKGMARTLEDTTPEGLIVAASYQLTLVEVRA